MLVALAVTSLVGAVAIGVAAARAWTPWLLVFVAIGAFAVVAYNLELFGGAFHNDATFALAWGAFPLLTAYFVSAERLTAEALLAAASAALLSMAQRSLSTQVRTMRRRARFVVGRIGYEDGAEEGIRREDFIRAPEAALRALTGASVLLACALVAARLG